MRVIIKERVRGFFDFIRQQGVVGLATAVVLGAAVTKVVSALVEDFINPLVGLFLGSTKALSESTLSIGSATLKWGHFLTTLIDFLIIALVVYVFFKILGLDQLDKKKE